MKKWFSAYWDTLFELDKDTEEPITEFEKGQERKRKKRLQVYDWYRYIDLSEE